VDNARGVHRFETIQDVDGDLKHVRCGERGLSGEALIEALAFEQFTDQKGHTVVGGAVFVHAPDRPVFDTLDQ